MSKTASVTYSNGTSTFTREVPLTGHYAVETTDVNGFLHLRHFRSMTSLAKHLREWNRYDRTNAMRTVAGAKILEEIEGQTVRSISL